MGDSNNDENVSKRIKIMEFQQDETLVQDEDQNYTVTSDDNNNDGNRVRVENLVSKCLENHLILDAVFRQLSYYDVTMNCALVNKYWHERVNNFMKNVKLFKLELHSSTFKFLEPQWKNLASNDDAPVGCLTEMTYKNPKAPRRGTSWDYVVNIKTLERKLKSVDKKDVWMELDYEQPPPPFVVDWLTLVCPWMSRLTIYDFYAQDHNNYLPLDAPKLRYLHLKRIPYRTTTNLPLPLTTLDHLSTINLTRFVHGGDNCFGGILTASRNIERIINFPLRYLKTVKDNVELQSKIKSIDLTKEDRMLASLFEFESLDPPVHLTLDTLLIPSDTEEDKSYGEIYGKTLANIIHTSQFSLKKLELHSVLSPEYLFTIPPLTALTTLVLTNAQHDFISWNPNTYYFFPCGFHPSEKFPNLHTVSLNLEEYGSLGSIMMSFPDTMFEKNGQNNFQSVRHLNISNRETGFHILPTEILEKVAAAFPQIKTLTVTNDKESIEVFLASVWKLWPKYLEELTLTVEWRGAAPYFLDSAITGIPEEKCKILRQSKEKQDINLTDYKSYPGISDMMSLKRISITLRHPYDRDVQKIISHIADLYGFQQVPGLEIGGQLSDLYKTRKNFGFITFF